MKILVCTHGQFGQALIQSAEMIGGRMKDAKAVSLLPEMSMDDYYEAVKAELPLTETALCLTDLFGGTPCSTLLSLSREYPIEILCGVNLPMLLETSSADSFTSAAELKEHLLEIYAANGFDVLARLKANQ